MVKFIHRDFGTDMYVDENRVEEYKAAGHKLAVSAPSKSVEASAQKNKPKTTKNRKSSGKKEMEEW